MQVNGETEANEPRDGLSRETGEIPLVISIRTAPFLPLLKKWRKEYPQVPWKHLLQEALKPALRPYAGKRYAHLVEPKEGEVAA